MLSSSDEPSAPMTITSGGTKPAAHGAPEGRYEYRIWPDGEGAPAARRLLSDWRLVDAEARSDIYLLSRLSGRRLVKLRGGRSLEIKARLPCYGPLQYWFMAHRADFPLKPADLEALGVSLGLEDGPDPQGARSPAHLLAALAEQGEPEIVRIAAKARATFEQDGCMAEAVRVRAAGCDRLTLGVETPSRERALAACEALGFLGFDNRHYGAALRAGPAPLLTR